MLELVLDRASINEKNRSDFGSSGLSQMHRQISQSEKDNTFRYARLKASKCVKFVRFPYF